MHYINYYFKELEYDKNTIKGIFAAPDCDVYCKFIFDRNRNTYDVFDNNVPKSEISPLPFYWLLRKLEKNGKLNKTEAKISY